MVNQPKPAKLMALLQELVVLLVNQRFEELFLRGLLYIHPSEEGNPKATITRYREILRRYPGLLVMPPTEAFSNYRLYGGETAPFLVEFDLWYDNAPADVMLVIPILLCGEDSICGYIYDIRFT